MTDQIIYFNVAVLMRLTVPLKVLSLSLFLWNVDVYGAEYIYISLQTLK
jgi:hypothetical protein